jgi:hypothetical protein
MMNAIRIETTIESETIHLPQLKPLVGKCVEIIVRERGMPVVTHPTREWPDVEAALLELSDYDFSALRDMRDVELNNQ